MTIVKTHTPKAAYNHPMGHYVRKEPIPYETAATPARKRWFRRISLRGLMRDRKASRYSALSPRHPDGSRTAIIASNNNGSGGSH